MTSSHISALAASSFAVLVSGCLLVPFGTPAPAASPQPGAAAASPQSTASAPAPGPSATAATSAAATPEPAPADRLPKVQPPEDTVELVFTHHMGGDRLSIYVPAGASVKETFGGSEETIVVQGKEIIDIGAGLEDLKMLKGSFADPKSQLLQEDERGMLWREAGKKARYSFSWNIDAGGIEHRCRSSHPLDTKAEAERLLAMCRTLRWLK
ncbi:hypothetical protein KEG38_52085 [Polyangium jinanense]|uniref:hypothetical protein n=1 Tax=Polyangium jinanense TaxID=2829994 RepID=UPI0023409480|nr:hypothetical protein [Polyangium jinanense]MDC3962465.1 hypothetical protein [Polyangium jinanense]